MNLRIQTSFLGNSATFWASMEMKVFISPGFESWVVEWESLPSLSHWIQNPNTYDQRLYRDLQAVKDWIQLYSYHVQCNDSEIIMACSLPWEESTWKLSLSWIVHGHSNRLQKWFWTDHHATMSVHPPCWSWCTIEWVLLLMLMHFCELSLGCCRAAVHLVHLCALQMGLRCSEWMPFVFHWGTTS